ncbi:hypothetical protein SVIO_025850 [Streptomyces violaceusniger]|uniref:Uncharacterized protein n=1 Tax=Streptomyces violaceusniger TaxID=68280 RepID=A0A4D4KTF1_STRVO|nr:hypothetical protein SVIO_025850 [Streptomyces violaceusniger]
MPVGEGEDGLDETDDAGRAAQVADVGLDGADGEGTPGGAVPTDGLAEGGGLDRVPGGGTGAVEFDVVDGVRGDAGASVGAGEHIGLSVDGGSGEGLTGRVVVGGAATDQAQDAVAVGESGAQALQDNGAAPSPGT